MNCFTTSCIRQYLDYLLIIVSLMIWQNIFPFGKNKIYDLNRALFFFTNIVEVTVKFFKRGWDPSSAKHYQGKFSLALMSKAEILMGPRVSGQTCTRRAHGKVVCIIWVLLDDSLHSVTHISHFSELWFYVLMIWKLLLDTIKVELIWMHRIYSFLTKLILWVTVTLNYVSIYSTITCLHK